jgi:hypothetical protein
MFRSLVVLASLAFAACSSTGPAFERLANPPALAAEQLEVRLTDERPSASSSLDVPVLSFLGSGESTMLPFELGLQSSLEFTLRQNLVPAARRLRVEVHVLEGVGGWSSDLFSESEKGSARVSVSVFDSAADHLLFTGTGESWAKRSSGDASRDGVIRTLGMAIQGAALECLASEPARAALGAP